jgi:predicted transcriptional regulator
MAWLIVVLGRRSHDFPDSRPRSGGFKQQDPEVSDQASSTNSTANYIELAADIVSAFVSNNSVPSADLPALISSVHGALQNVANPAPVQTAEKPVPAVPVKKSITPEAIISLIDGKPYKSLKRHLSGKGLTPEQYREQYGLPRDYPMVAPAYAQKRSELAKQSGLGQQRRKAAAKSADAGETISAPTRTSKKGGLKKAA